MAPASELPSHEKAKWSPAATSAAEGSVAPVSEIVVALPSGVLAGACSVAVGGTLTVVIVVVSLAQAPWSSQTVSVTVLVAGPSGATTVGFGAGRGRAAAEIPAVGQRPPAVSVAVPWSVSVRALVRRCTARRRSPPAAR